MSVQTQIDRIGQNVANTYAVLSALGADMPTEQNTDNLAETAGSAKAVLYSEQTLTEEQQTQARENIGASPLKKYGKLVVFGDSLGQGVNNDNYSFVDILSESGVFESVTKCCVGGACIGPYQKNSDADGYSLVEQIERYSSDAASADIIMLEYGANDIRSMLARNITMGTAGDSSTTTTICGYTKKAMERIRELNPDVKIIWLAFSLNDFEYNRIKSGTGFADAELLFEATALKLARPYLASVINAAAGMPSSGMSSDGAHPNTEGHKYVANQILHNMFVPWDYPHLHRPLILSGNVDAHTNLSIDGSFSGIYELLAAGVTVTLSHQYNTNFPIVLYPSMYNSYFIVFNTAVTDDGSTWTKVSIKWGKDNSITTYQNAMLKKSYVSATSQTSMAIGGTHKLKESIIDKQPVFASLAYELAMGRVSGSAGNKKITFNNITNVGEGVYINFASFNVSDDGLTLTLGATKRIKVSASGNTIENNTSLAFGNVCIIDT